MKSHLPLAVLLALLGAGLGGCMSSEREASLDQDRCAARGLAPATPAFDDCLAGMRADRRDAQSRRAARMQDVQNMQMDSFMHSSMSSF